MRNIDKEKQEEKFALLQNCIAHYSNLTDVLERLSVFELNTLSMATTLEIKRRKNLIEKPIRT